MQALEAADPAKIGPFVLRARLGQGGMGLVYLGTDSTGRDAAVKVIQPSLVQDRGFHDRFLREARLLARVDGACTARVLAADIDAQPAYLAVEFVPGPTLQEQVMQEGAVPHQLLHPLGVGLLEALHAIHERGVVHRDLKPANIILSRQGPKVIDFGIARLSDSTGLTTAGAVLGSPGWMAPEQFSDAPATAATDVFAWGATMAFAATGRVPFAGDRLEAVYVRVLNDAPDIAGVPPDLLPILLAALAKGPQDRPSVRTLLARLLDEPEAAVAPMSDAVTVLRQGWHFDVPTVAMPAIPTSATTVATAAHPPRTLQEVSRPRRSRWVWVAAAVAAVALSAGGATIATQQPARERRVEAAADKAAADKAAAEATRDGFGAVAKEGSLGAFSVALGDCLQEPIADGAQLEQVEDVAAVPCSQPHAGEVYAEFDLPDGDFPGDEAISASADERCVAEFAEFVGTPYEDSELEFFTLQPTESSWTSQQDRAVFCVVGAFDATSTGTLKGAAR